MGWYLVLAIAMILPWVLAHFDYTHLDVIGGLLVLTLYLAVVVGIVILLLRTGRRLRGKEGLLREAGGRGLGVRSRKVNRRPAPMRRRV